MKKDGARARSGETLLRIEGDGRSILTAERVALNFLQHLSGIATLTARFRTAVRGYPVAILDTRKTLPGWRSIQKWAVTLGGGTNHRRSLSTGSSSKTIISVFCLTKRRSVMRASSPRVEASRTPITVEVESLAEVTQALAGQADIILLDNMTPAMVRAAVRMVKRRARRGVRRRHLEERSRDGGGRARPHFDRRPHSFSACRHDDAGARAGGARARGNANRWQHSSSLNRDVIETI